MLCKFSLHLTTVHCSLSSDYCHFDHRPWRRSLRARRETVALWKPARVRVFFARRYDRATVCFVFEMQWACFVYDGSVDLGNLCLCFVFKLPVYLCLSVLTQISPHFTRSRIVPDKRIGPHVRTKFPGLQSSFQLYTIYTETCTISVYQRISLVISNEYCVLNRTLGSLSAERKKPTKRAD